jgi:branched-subunit amino acid transport protein
MSHGQTFPQDLPMNESTLPVTALTTILGLGVVSVITRGFFLWPEREIPLPGWLRRGLGVAPLAALAAIIAPEVLLVQGQWPQTLADPRWPAVLAATAWYAARPGTLGPLVVGVLVYLPLKLLAGW